MGMYLLTSIFMLLGLAVLAAGLYMRFDTTQWDTMQSIRNGRLSVYIYMILGAAIFLLSIIGQYGAGKARRRFSLFIFQLGTLACVAGAEGLLLMCSFILCFRKSDEGLPSHYRQQNSPQGGHVTQVIVGTNGRTQPV